MEIRLAIRLGTTSALKPWDSRPRWRGLNIRQDPPSRSRATGNWSSGTALQGLWPEPHHQGGADPLSGPIDQPHLNIETYRDPDTIEDNVTVGVRVTGPAAKPKITVYSEPQMAQSEQLSHLLRGKGLQTSGEDGGFNGLLVAGAVSQASGVVSSIGESLGMSDVALDTAGSGDDTQVTLSAYLLPGLQFQYGVGVFSPIAEFKLRYELMPRLYLQAMSRGGPGGGYLLSLHPVRGADDKTDAWGDVYPLCPTC